MASILNVIETKTEGQKTFSVAYNDESFIEYTEDNMPEDVAEFIYYAIEFNETYRKTRNSILYFKP